MAKQQHHSEPQPLTIADLIKEAVRKYRTKQAVAEHMGINPSRLSRLLHKDERYSLNVENCLRLAALTGRPPGDVLRAAGRSDTADLVDTLFVEGQTHGVPAATATAQVRHSDLPTEILESLTRVVEATSEQSAAADSVRETIDDLCRLLGEFIHRQTVSETGTPGSTKIPHNPGRAPAHGRSDRAAAAHQRTPPTSRTA